MINELKTKRINGVAILATHNLKNIQSLPIHSIKCLHINLIEGKPVSKPKDVPSLIKPDGTFYCFPFFFIRLLVGLIRKEDIEKEIRTQLQTLLNNDIKITEIN